MFNAPKQIMFANLSFGFTQGDYKNLSQILEADFSLQYKENMFMHTCSQMLTSFMVCTFARPQFFGFLSVSPPEIFGLYCRPS